MDVQRVAEQAVLITISAGQCSAMLASSTLARAFGLELCEAERVLAHGGSIVAARQSASASCLALLRLLGVQAQALQDASAPRFDLSIRLADPTDEGARLWLAEFLPQASLRDLCGPSGLVIVNLTAEAAQAMAVTLQRKEGVQVTRAAQAGALYDLFAPPRFAGSSELTRYLTILGHGESAHVAPIGSALASGLEAAMAALVVARFRSLGIVAVHQAFQRFDLHVTGPGHLPPRDVADFLSARGLRNAKHALESGAPVLIERSLTRAAARQFLNDYRHIGLPIRATLCQGALQNG